MRLDRTLADIFVDEGFVEREILGRFLSGRSDVGRPLGDLLVEAGLISETQRLRAMALHTGMPFLDLGQVEIQPEACAKLSLATAERLVAVPVEATGYAATVAMADPLDLEAIDELGRELGCDVDPAWARTDDILDAIRRMYGRFDDLGGRFSGEEHTDARKPESDGVVHLVEAPDDEPAVQLASAVLRRALYARASDLHVDPGPTGGRVRFRIDGALVDVMRVNDELFRPFVSRLKVLARLDVAERRIPQDGRCTVRIENSELDLRVATYPTVLGEKVSIRLLDRRQGLLDLNQLGLAANELSVLKTVAESPQGLVLVTGPTGSGKTTTLYALLNDLNSRARNILTIEDPVEYQIDGIQQANVNVAAGLTFAVGLRAILRQDPDVVLVGESRDPETAQTSVEAALTGHLVLTSLHANDSCAAIARLLEMEIEPFLVGTSVSLSMAQRLLRTVCVHCKAEDRPDPALLQRCGLPEGAPYFRGAGCEKCGRTGYRGRTAVYEVLRVDAPLRRMIHSNAPATDLRRAAVARGMTTLFESARAKVAEGVTTVEEALRCVPMEDAE